MPASADRGPAAARPLDSTSERLSSGQPRRGFLTRLAAVVAGGIVALAPLAVGAFAFLDPLRKRRRDLPQAREGAGNAVDAEGFVEVAQAGGLPADGSPQLFKVVADRTDAWTFFPDQPIGAVYLRQEGDEVVAFNVQCPHAGCAVDYNPAAREFDCPCHKSSFTLAGERSANSPSARDLDRLETKVEDGRIKVKYQNFRTGTAESIAE